MLLRLYRLSLFNLAAIQGLILNVQPSVPTDPEHTPADIAEALRCCFSHCVTAQDVEEIILMDDWDEALGYAITLLGEKGYPDDSKQVLDFLDLW